MSTRKWLQAYSNVIKQLNYHMGKIGRSIHILVDDYLNLIVGPVIIT